MIHRHAYTINLMGEQYLASLATTSHGLYIYQTHDCLTYMHCYLSQTNPCCQVYVHTTSKINQIHTYPAIPPKKYILRMSLSWHAQKKKKKLKNWKPAFFCPELVANCEQGLSPCKEFPGIGEDSLRRASFYCDTWYHGGCLRNKKKRV